MVFDALPGQVFPAHVTSSDAGILAGQEAVNGQLSQPEQSTRWVRDAQRMRIHVALDRAAGQTAADRRPRYGAAVQQRGTVRPHLRRRCRSTW